MQRATRISVCVIAVDKSHELLLKVRQRSSFLSTRRNFFLYDYARDSTSTTSRCFFPRRRTLVPPYSHRILTNSPIE